MSSPPPSPTSFVTYHLRPRPRPQSGRSTFDYRHRNRNTKQAVSHQAASQPSTSSSGSSTTSSSSSNNNNNTTTATTTTITDRHSPLLRFTQVDIFLQLSHTSLRCFRCFGAKIEEQLEQVVGLEAAQLRIYLRPRTWLICYFGVFFALISTCIHNMSTYSFIYSFIYSSIHSFTYSFQHVHHTCPCNVEYKSKFYFCEETCKKTIVAEH